MTAQQFGPLSKPVSRETVTRSFLPEARGPRSPGIPFLPAVLGSLWRFPPCAPVSSPSVKPDFADPSISPRSTRTGFLAMGAGMAQLEGYYFSAALSCTFLVSCLLFSAFSRALREPYMDEIFHLPQAQRYCEGHFSLSQVGSPTCQHPRMASESRPGPSASHPPLTLGPSAHSRKRTPVIFCSGF